MLKINKNVILKNYNYVCPTTFLELKNLIDKEILKNGPNCSLNHIDISKITNLTNLFAESNFDGDISEWDTSRVKYMRYMFFNSKYTGKHGDISSWNVSNVEDMSYMFGNSIYEGDISEWNVSNLQYMNSMFHNALFNNDISKWNVSNVLHMRHAFNNMFFNQNLSSWYINPLCDIDYAFVNLKNEFKPIKMDFDKFYK